MSHVRAARVITSLLAALLAGCAAPMEMGLDRPVTPVSKPKSIAPIPLVFSPGVDARPEISRPSAGRVGGREVRGEQLLSWIDRSLGTLRGAHFAATSETTETPSWRVRPHLRQFYASSLAVSKNANIVLELEVVSPGGRTYTRVYRGRITSVNWWNATGEVEQAFTTALRNCLKRIALDLDTVVKEEPSGVAVATTPAR